MHKMRQKQQFIRPVILQEVELLGDSPILNGSVVDNAVVVSNGQDVHDVPADDQDWNHQWEW